MFPPLVQVPAVTAMFVAAYLSLQVLDGRPSLTLGWGSVVGAATLLGFALLMRVYDELKDVEADLRLGKAGDPRYKDRAIVTGRVQVGDLVALRWGTTFALIALNAGLGWPWPGAVFVGILVLTWLSFKWFFWPAVSRNLLLAFATHNPLTLVVLSYVPALYVRIFDHVPGAWMWVPLAGIWAPIAAWETARKIRAPADETSYQTYSMMLGWRVAPFLPALFVTISAAMLTAFARHVGLHVALPVAVFAAAALVWIGAVRFVLAPSARTANLRPLADVYALVSTLGLVIACCAHTRLTF